MTPEERDLGIRTVLAEAGNQGEDGQLAVSNTIRNRVASGKYGDGVGGVVTRKYAFEPMLHYGTGRGNDPARFSEGDPKYQQAARIFDTVMAGGAPDNTHGATHFINAQAQAAQGRDIPTWAQGKPTNVIGAHAFFAPDGKLDPTNAAQSPTMAATSTPETSSEGAAAAARFLARAGQGSPTMQGQPQGKFSGLQALVDQMKAGQGGGGAEPPGFLERMVWGDKGRDGVLSQFHPFNGQGLLGQLFGGPKPPDASSGPPAPQGSDGGAGAPLTGAPVTPVTSSPLAPPPDIPIPMARPGGPGVDLTNAAVPIPAATAAPLISSVGGTPAAADAVPALPAAAEGASGIGSALSSLFSGI